jgi:hypothetical protein
LLPKRRRSRLPLGEIWDEVRVALIGICRD